MTEFIENFDVVIIGGGPAGYVSAIRGKQLGMNVAIIEKENLGGICLNWGCIPTKTLLKSSEINHLLNNLEEFGFSVENIKFDFNKIINRSRKVAKQLSSGIKYLLDKNKVKVINGTAKLIDCNTINIKGNKEINVKAKNIIIATGAKPKNIQGFETDGKLIWNYRDAMTPDQLPKNIIIVGSGAIGIEFASFYQNMGTKVIILEVADRILNSEDEEISDFAHKSFTKQGIEIFTSTNIKTIIKKTDNVNVVFENKGKIYDIIVDRVIIAIGITANTENLGLENTKIKLDRNHIKTNEYLKTDQDNIYAIGDVTGAPWLAHKASHEGVIAIENIAKLKTHPINLNNIPGCIYSRPQIASVGITEKKALELGKKINIGRFPLIANGKAVAIGETEGFVKTIYDADTKELLGAHMIGAEVTEMIQGFVIAKTLEATDLEIKNTIFPHPTISEAMHESSLDSLDVAIHI